MEPNITIELTGQEATVLLQLIHLATQARGMEVAEAAVILTKKIQDAAKATLGGQPKVVQMDVEDKAA